MLLRHVNERMDLGNFFINMNMQPVKYCLFGVVVVCGFVKLLNQQRFKVR